jgi:DNA-binding CsgD family transcriptional regulator
MEAPRLSPQENKAALLALEYRPIKEIAGKMHISYAHAGVLLYNIRQKMGARCHAEMIVMLQPFKDTLGKIVIP